MGGGTYSFEDRTTRSMSAGYHTKSTNEIFKQKNINNAMEPYGIDIRESRDSEEHQNSVPIIIALDVTGSMGSIPHFLVKEGFPEIMKGIIDSGIADPQVLFMGIGDHEYDSAPLQVGQFESNDELLDKWLTDVYLEGGGGGNDGESYSLAWYFAGYHTETDSFEKRGKKGYLFTIGDEPTLKSLPKSTMKKIMGDFKQHEDYTAEKLLEKASEKYHVYHIHIKETRSGMRQSVIDGWKQIMSDDLVIAEHKSDVVSIISDIICKDFKYKPLYSESNESKIVHEEIYL